MERQPKSVLVDALLKYVADDRKKAGIGFHAGNPSVQVPSAELTLELIVTEMPYKVFSEGRQKPVPLMMGVTRHDGSFVFQKMYDYFILPNNLIGNTTYIREELLADILRGLGIPDTSYALVESISDSFMGDAKYSGNLTEKMPGLIDIMSVFFMKAMSYRTTQLHSQIQPKSYYYSFDHLGQWSLHGVTNIGGPIPSGVSHTDDQIYLFSWFPLSFAKDREVSKRFIKYWVNFAYYGNPNGPDGSEEVWPAYTHENPQYILIDREDSIGRHYRSDWKNNSLELFPSEPSTGTPGEEPSIPPSTPINPITDDPDPSTVSDGPSESPGDPSTLKPPGSNSGFQQKAKWTDAVFLITLIYTISKISVN
jgi:carboxylesterase type B